MRLLARCSRLKILFSREVPVFTRLAFFSLAALFLTGSAMGQSLPNHLNKRVVADYVYWSKYGSPAYGAAQIPYHHLTHINHAGVSFDASGTLSVPDGFVEPELNRKAHAAVSYTHLTLPTILRV